MGAKATQKIFADLRWHKKKENYQFMLYKPFCSLQQLKCEMSENLTQKMSKKKNNSITLVVCVSPSSYIIQYRGTNRCPDRAQ